MLDAHETFRTGPHGFDDRWRTAAGQETWKERWSAVEDYLEQVIPRAAEKHASKEGSVQAAASSFMTKHRVMLDREVMPHFRDTSVKAEVLDACKGPLAEALNKHTPAPGKIPQSFGPECDLLALDSTGALLAVEVKPSVGGSIVWAPAQATMYARVLRAWTQEDRDCWRGVIDGMYSQRRRLKLAPELAYGLSDQPKIVPVVALQRGASPVHVRRLWAVQKALLAEGVGDPELKVYLVSLSGRLDPLEAPSG